MAETSLDSAVAGLLRQVKLSGAIKVQLVTAPGPALVARLDALCRGWVEEAVKIGRSAPTQIGSARAAALRECAAAVADAVKAGGG